MRWKVDEQALKTPTDKVDSLQRSMAYLLHKLNGEQTEFDDGLKPCPHCGSDLVVIIGDPRQSDCIVVCNVCASTARLCAWNGRVFEDAQLKAELKAWDKASDEALVNAEKDGDDVR